MAVVLNMEDNRICIENSEPRERLGQNQKLETVQQTYCQSNCQGHVS